MTAATTAAIRRLEMIHVRDLLREQGVVASDEVLQTMRAYVDGVAERRAVDEAVERAHDSAFQALASFH